MSTAVVLVSGGLDSCVTAAIAARDHELAFLHATYGQRTARKERVCFEAIAEHFGAKRHTLDLTHLAAIGGSALTDVNIELETHDEASSGIPRSYVPFRNANLLAAAVAWAEVLHAEHIFIGTAQVDYSGYPDCRREFLDAFEKAAALGTKPETKIAIASPLMEKTKKEIVQLGLELSAPLALTWSCYQAEDRACGRCDSCGYRLKGFAEAGTSDPIEYAAD